MAQSPKQILNRNETPQSLLGTDGAFELALSTIETWNPSIAGELAEAEAGGPIELARAFVVLRQIKDRAEEALKPLNALYEELKTIKIPQRFEEAGVPSVNLDEGFRITTSHLVRASIKGGKKEEAMQWLKDNQLEDIVTETVNSSTLSAVAKTMAEENRELDPELFNVAILPTTSVTKVKK